MLIYMLVVILLNVSLMNSRRSGYYKEFIIKNESANSGLVNDIGMQIRF